ncbi:MAG: kinase-like domain-containing protein [Monoraphidium minutum]|nr:MAG: kinase-like domain-containing protein [Monoraphidium minutum]
MRMPVFISPAAANATFGAPAQPFNCSVCYDAATRTKLWGFATAVVNAEELANGSEPLLQGLLQQGYDFELLAPQPDGSVFTVASAPLTSRAPAEAPVSLAGAGWSLRVAPARGWAPGWRDPMVATAVVVSGLIGLLVCAILVNRRQMMWLISELKATNRALADEKRRMDVLLCRQYSLINALERGAPGGGSSSIGPHSATMERIETLRRTIGAGSMHGAAAEELELQELLGEGSFGKVFKGLWRGSVVAIKTMVLPARMSGAEKRERMLVMEAAISSALTHPNIVQTYTYTIKPTTDSYARSVDAEMAGFTSQPRRGAPPPSSLSRAAQARSLPSAMGSHVYNFEVCLVLEYCDRGSLRDALDGGAFWAADHTLNYAAVLDTAADVARAMVHLHRQQIIHSDLKARNVLLKSDGGDGRGLVAKVADFGLAVRIDNLGTHVSEFQGTATHIAPEVHLQARVSKAADVYAFGVTLWELYTGGHAYADVPPALLGHRVAVQGARPGFASTTPREYLDLVDSCWDADPTKRPTFEAVLEALKAMRLRIPSGTAGAPRALGRADPARAGRAPAWRADPWGSHSLWEGDVPLRQLILPGTRWL